MAEDAGRPIIIVRKKKQVESHHGGAWKVAMADFMSTMFALFLTLWILTQNVEVKRAVANYFRHPMEIPGNVSPLSGSISLLPHPLVFPGTERDKQGGEGSSPESLTGSRPRFVAPDNAVRPVAAVKPEEIITKDEWIDFKKMVDKLWNELGIDASFEMFKDNLQIYAIENGVVVQIINQPKSPLFSEGSRSFTPVIRHVLKLVAEEFVKLPKNKIEIDGHEPDPNLPDSKVRWALSSQMADDARTEMEDDGIPPAQIAKVGGCADARLLDPTDKKNPCNRRISILMRPRQWVPENY